MICLVLYWKKIICIENVYIVLFNFTKMHGFLTLFQFKLYIDKDYYIEQSWFIKETKSKQNEQ